VSNNRRPPQRDQRRRQNNKRPADLWAVPAALPERDAIVPADDPTALIRSLGDPPLAGGSEITILIATVVDRAAALSTALALSADLLPAEDA
jgi:hypothetical protein